MREGESQDPFRLNRVRREGDIVKRAGAESSHVSAPIGQVRKHNHRNTPGCRRQNPKGSAEITIRQVVTTQRELKCLLLDARARFRQGPTTDGSQPQTASDFFGLLTLKGIGRYD